MAENVDDIAEHLDFVDHGEAVEHDEGDGNDDEGDDGNEEEDDEDDDDDGMDPSELLKEFGDHKLMERAQKALFAQLGREYDRVTVEIKELESELKKVKAQREQVACVAGTLGENG